MSPPEMPRPDWAPPRSEPPAESSASPRGCRDRWLAQAFWGQAGSTLLLVAIGNVEMPSWREHPAAPLAYLVVAAGAITLPFIPAFWAVILLRSTGGRGHHGTYAAGGLILWLFQVMAFLPYVQ